MKTTEETPAEIEHATEPAPSHNADHPPQTAAPVDAGDASTASPKANRRTAKGKVAHLSKGVAEGDDAPEVVTVADSRGKVKVNRLTPEQTARARARAAELMRCAPAELMEEVRRTCCGLLAAAQVQIEDGDASAQTMMVVERAGYLVRAMVREPGRTPKAGTPRQMRPVGGVPARI